MSFISRISLVAVSASLLCTSCLQEDFAGKEQNSDRPAIGKIVNSPTGAVPGQLLVCMATDDTETALAEMTKSDAPVLQSICHCLCICYY